MTNRVEQWKAEKHGLDVWPDLVRYAQTDTPMSQINESDLERMKWYGVFYRRRDGQGTYMLRIRITGCELTAEQAREVAFVAYQYGYGIVDVTTRANLQVQGLQIRDVPKALKRLNDVGLTAQQTGHDNIRNVFCDPLSGIDPRELFDTRPLCRDVTSMFLDSRVYSDLPRKFNIAIHGGREPGVHYWTQDISFLACRVPSQVMFRVLIAGNQGQNPQLGQHLPVLVAPQQVVFVTQALLDLFRQHGSRDRRDRARFRYLVEHIGISGVLEHLEQRLEFPLVPCVQEPSGPSGYGAWVGWFRQKQPGLWAMGLCVPVGRLTWQQLEALAVLSRRWGSGQLRTTPEQGILVPDIASGFRDAAATSAAAAGLSVHADTLTRNTVACTGRQFCNIAVTETKGHMLQLIEKLRQRALTLHGIRIHMSGCPSSCAGHHTADIGLKGVRVRRLLGTREGFDVYLGGGVAGRLHLGLLYKLGVDTEQLPQLIESVIREYYLKHKPGQTFSAYWRQRLKDEQAAKADEHDYRAPTWLCENCNYRFLGEDPPIYCPSCAGLRRHFARWDDTVADQSSGATGQSDVERQEKTEQETAGTDGEFHFAARQESLSDSHGLAVEVAGTELALFRVDGRVYAIENSCPHAGAPLADGSLSGGVVTCPWHAWTFNVASGCSLEPPGNSVRCYETKVEDGTIFVQFRSSHSGSLASSPCQVSTRPCQLAGRGNSVHPCEGFVAVTDKPQ